ncbi:type IV pili methyl-accepting chemotaxis transducer N-terminal domain-containing protein [Aureispira anguillae]|uniref:Type IV pili methyl-accepting chemotaxis transducer N-terminal domain-containing protein n=1 Tax=Aureispira anguillae TaxID=2864201 RepID=A0A916DRT4_9BACT|nr:type IV pili methyl-accepting chemotaxis transducer N-terminal domain-containing protein [Aureispira anguillae]BDS12054.1 type IV pili methyl-accepting chemotaxis transducer N-terminal domain-containing protein [Aureispira anguillae]
MKQVVLVVLMIFSLVPLDAQQNDKAFLIGDLLNKAGAQRMLTQRMGKAYIAMYIGMDVDANKKVIDGSVALFENRLQELKASKINGRYNQRLNKVQNLWTSYKELIMSRPTKENIEKLLVDNTVILESCELVVYELELHGSRFSKKNDLYKMNSNIVHLENVAGRQRMLTERILFYFLAHQSIIGLAPQIEKELNLALQDYEKTLVELMGATENTPEIDYRLTLLSNEWETIAKFCTVKVEDASRIKDVLKLGNKLLASMDEVTVLYEDLIDFRVASLLLNNAINMANKQSMLVQKIAKSYIVAGMVDHDKHRKNLEDDITLFEHHIDELKLFAPIDEITTGLDIVDDLWTNYRNQAMSPTTKEGAKKLLYANNELLRGCDNVVMLLEMYAKIYKKSVSRFNSDMSHWTNQIGRQEMLTERILMYSYAMAWGVDDSHLAEELERTGYKYIKNLNELNSAFPVPDLERRGQALVDKWGTIKIYLEDIDNHKEDLLEWALSLSKELDALTGLYEERINKMVTEEAIDKANYQCMLSQKIATSYLAIGMNLNVKHYEQQFDKDKLLFQRQLEELEAFANTNDLKEVLTEVNQLWNTYQITFTGKLLKEKTPHLLEISQEMLTACEQVVERIKKGGESEQVAMVDDAAHLRTMTEQVLLFALAERWEVGNFQAENMKVLNAFEQKVKFLSNNENNSPKITKSLTAISKHHKRLKESCQKLKEVDLYSILVLHNVLLLETEKLTKAYEESILF